MNNNNNMNTMYIALISSIVTFTILQKNEMPYANCKELTRGNNIYILTQFESKKNVILNKFIKSMIFWSKAQGDNTIEVVDSLYSPHEAPYPGKINLVWCNRSYSDQIYFLLLILWLTNYIIIAQYDYSIQRDIGLVLGSHVSGQYNFIFSCHRNIFHHIQSLRFFIPCLWRIPSIRSEHTMWLIKYRFE